jgi:hypothetical protein
MAICGNTRRIALKKALSAPAFLAFMNFFLQCVSASLLRALYAVPLLAHAGPNSDFIRRGRPTSTKNENKMSNSNSNDKTTT